MTHRRKPRSEQANALDPKIMRAARKMSQQLAEHGYPHALIGGLAVNVYGYKRTTSDVDFLVTRDVAEDLAGASLGGDVHGKTIQLGLTGVTVDLLFPKAEERFLERAITDARGVLPVIPQEALVYMKLAAGRMKDTADVIELLKRGKLDVRRVSAYLKKHRPDLAEDFESMISQAILEAD